MEAIAQAVMMIEIDSKSLEFTARGMLGITRDAVTKLSLNRPQQLQLPKRQISFDTITNLSQALLMD